MSAPITLKIFCIYNRKKELRAHLKEQVGILLIKFEEVASAAKEHGQFIVTVTDEQKCYELGLSVGRMYILLKTNISADDNNGGY